MMFSNCSLLKSLPNISKWNTVDVTDIGWKDNLFERRLMHADKMRLLILSLEKRFNITIPDSCLRYDSLSSINKIGKIIEGEINEKTEAYM